MKTLWTAKMVALWLQFVAGADPSFEITPTVLERACCPASPCGRSTCL